MVLYATPATGSSEVSVNKIPLAISSCLTGNEVRYDGGHKYNVCINETLNAFFSFNPVCPETGIGLGVPRAPIRLQWSDNGIRACGVHDASLDVTQQLVDYADQQYSLLDDVCGYILKSRSPSCAMQGVEVFQSDTPGQTSSGIYAGQLMRLATLLPFEEEHRLDNPALRDNFLERVFVYDRLRHLLASPELSRLRKFHLQHKLTIMSHDPDQLENLNKLLASATENNVHEKVQTYANLLMQTLSVPAIRDNHVNVLQYILANLSDALTDNDKHELDKSIANYQSGLHPLLVPLTLLKQHLHKAPDQHISQCHYMQSYAEQLARRDLN